MEDVVNAIVAALGRFKPVLVVGPPGCGKVTAATKALAKVGHGTPLKDGSPFAWCYTCCSVATSTRQIVMSAADLGKVDPDILAQCTVVSVTYGAKTVGISL